MSYLYCYERGLSFNRGFFFYMDRSYLVYDRKMGSFGFGSKDISEWKSTGIYNYPSRSNECSCKLKK